MVRFWGIVVATGVLVAAGLSGCTPTGDSYAASLAERVIIGIGDDITPPYPKPHEAEFLAALAVQSPRLPHTTPQVDYGIDLLGWDGHSGDEEGAQLDIRVKVHVNAASAEFFGQSYVEGWSTRCWRLTIFGFHDYDSLTLREFSCPESAVARIPSPAPLPEFPDDLDARLTTALQGASTANIDERVTAEFPEDYYTIRSEARDGELVVALGIPSEDDCAVAVRGADGAVEVHQGWRSVLLQPGETGCSPALYFDPVSTH